jgi:hypothetical protein
MVVSMLFIKMIQDGSILYYLFIIYMISNKNNKTKKFRAGANEMNPTGNPADGPTGNPVDGPTGNPVDSPTVNPTDSPTVNPTVNPTDSQIETPIVEGPEGSPPPPSDNFVPPASFEQQNPVEPETLQLEDQEDNIPIQSPSETDKVDVEDVATGAAAAGVVSNETTPLDPSNEIEDFRQKMADPENQTDYLLLNPNISTEPNKNKSYVRIGILHFTDSAAINVLRDTITSFGNLLGNKGVDNIIYDKLRNTVLTKVGIILGENRRCYNTTVQIERIDDNIFAHVYGTLYEKKE